MMRTQTTSHQTYVHINISYKLAHHTAARCAQPEMVKTSFGLLRVRPCGSGDSTSSSMIGSRREVLGCGAGTGVVGGAARTGVEQ